MKDPKKDLKRINRDNKDDLERSFISKLLSSLSEDMLKRFVFSIVFTVPGVRRPFIRAMLIMFILGVLTALGVYLLLYGVPSFPFSE
jgi:hypothetical protein